MQVQKHSLDTSGNTMMDGPTLRVHSAKVDDPKKFLRSLFDTAVSASQPQTEISNWLPAPPKGRILVIGAGKAATGMAQAINAHYQSFDRISGLVITRHGQKADAGRIDVLEAAHPVPDQFGLAATQRLMAACEGLTEEDLVIALISGGASALMVAPLQGLDLDDKIELNQALLASGATISDMNCIRRHLSQVKGGRLAALCAPARVVSLLVSDVPGDDATVIASGPCTADHSTSEDALAILDRLNIDLPKVRNALKSPESESIKPNDPRIANVEQHIVCSPQLALEAAAELAQSQGVTAHILGDALEGEARDMGIILAGLARQIALREQPFSRPCVLLSGGETTVSLRGADYGIGGRNVEFLLSYLIAARGFETYALAADTDGVDGAAEVAGAVISEADFTRSRELGLNPVAALTGHDAHRFFERLGAQIITGPTGTNVNDFRAIYIP